ncbi:MAG: DUF1249 domain-containing protein [Porticoccus sp.]|nr:DUF1249 domain-containing protein [Porticoccus sp.]
MADCDANYVRLMKLFPNITEGNERKIGIHHSEDCVVQLQVLEQTPYTTLIRLEQEIDEVGSGQDLKLWLRLPTLTLRLYHDARVAEVVSCEGSRRAYPRYEYPNERMYHQDEKAQWNQFLAEWLAYCLKYGYDIEPSFGVPTL